MIVILIIDNDRESFVNNKKEGENILLTVEESWQLTPLSLSLSNSLVSKRRIYEVGLNIVPIRKSKTMVKND